MFDVFYQGPKPGLFPFEQPAQDLDHAARLSRTKFFWFIDGHNDYSDFDFHQRPAPWQSEFVHVWPSQWQTCGGTYLANKHIVKNRQWHFRNDAIVPRRASLENWHILDNIDRESFDFTWHPNPLDPPYIYHFPSQHQSASGVTYTVPGATEIKLSDAFVVKSLPRKEHWHLPEHINSDTADYTWHPNPLDPPYIYHFPSQHQSASGVTYTVPGATEIKLSDAFVVKSLPRKEHWHLPEHINSDTADYTWHPNPLDPPYVYHFPVKWGWQNVGGVEFRVPGATEHKYIDVIIAETQGNKDYWYIPDNIDPGSIDYSWCPDPTDPPLIYQFPVKWGWDRIGGPEYRVPGATDIKFLEDFHAKTLSNMDNWVVPANVDRTSFDFSWAPHPAEEPYVYKFPTVWNAVGGPEYHTPGATQEKFLDVLVAKTLPDPTHWSVPEEVNANQVDFSWVPHPQDPPYIYHFGTEFQQTVGLTYTVPGATEIKFAGPVPTAQQHDKPVLEVLDIFFIDKNNVSAKTRYERLQQRYPSIHKVRYANSIVDTITRCLARSKTNKFWVISSENIYDDFDFSWHAQPWQSYMTHVFGSQWQKWSDTFLINRFEFQRHTQWAGSIEQFPNLNFVKDQPVMIPDDLHDIYWVSHGNATDQYQQLSQKYPDIRSTRFVDSYLETLRRIMATVTTEYVWVVSSLCDYTRFDFSWQPEPWQREMMHVFPSGQQTRGDTFYIHVPSFQKQMAQLELLDWFHTVNYCSEQTVPRLPMPVVRYTTDSAVDILKLHNFEHPYTWFVPNHKSVEDRALAYEPAIWYAKDRKIHTFSQGNSVILAPRDVKNHIRTQAYDYPYIDKQNTIKESPLDIIYISNGEPDAERWYQHLCNTAGRPVKRVQNIDGRAAAYKAAAQCSETPWFFAVFAKLEVTCEFDWLWQPDRLQAAKHYIFHSRNPVNGLEYGHMGVIAYNRQLVLHTVSWQLDFTLSQPHAVVPVLSGVAHYNTTPELTWRTAFREAIKLHYDITTTGSVESRYRLKQWLAPGDGPHAEWSQQGAKDAVHYAQSVDNHMPDLQRSFEWQWLHDYWLTQPRV